MRTELKTLGAVWDPHGRVWSITSDKLKLAIALVENQALIPATATGEIIDPFEEEGNLHRLVALEKGDGATYEVRDALGIVGARWDKTRRSWMISENRAGNYFDRTGIHRFTASVVTVPEPSALSLLTTVGGLLGSTVLIRRRCRRAKR